MAIHALCDLKKEVVIPILVRRLISANGDGCRLLVLHSRLASQFITAQTGLYSSGIIVWLGIKGLPDSFHLVYVSGAEPQSGSFEELAMPLFDQLYNFAHWLTQNRDEADDLVQETYVKALKGFSSFQLGTNFRAWMYRILRNTFLTSRTGLTARMTVPLDPEEELPEPPLERETPETILIERSNRQLVQSAIEELPVHFRETLLLCEVEEMSYQEIAETLSIPIGTVMSRLSRARKTLEEHLREKLRREQNNGLRVLEGTTRHISRR